MIRGASIAVILLALVPYSAQGAPHAGPQLVSRSAGIVPVHPSRSRILRTYPVSKLPYSLVTGSDGNVWIEGIADPPEQTQAIERLHPADGTIDSFPLPEQLTSFVTELVLHSDGNIWFVDRDIGSISKLLYVTPNGTFGSYARYDTCFEFISDLTNGPNGKIWDVFSETSATEPDCELPATVEPLGFLVPGGGYDWPMGYLAIGGDGKLWTAATLTSTVARLDPKTGIILATFKIDATQLTADKDSHGIWFVSNQGSTIGRIDGLNSHVRSYNLPSGVTVDAVFNGNLVALGDGSIWFPLSGGCVGHFKTLPKERLEEVCSGMPGSDIVSVALGPDGNIWYGDDGLNVVGVIKI